MDTGLKIFAVMCVLDLIILYCGGHLWKIRKSRAKRALEKSWITSEFGSELHIIPQMDMMEHVGVQCACSPKRIPGRVPDNPRVFWTVRHNAMDGRKSW